MLGTEGLFADLDQPGSDGYTFLEPAFLSELVYLCGKRWDIVARTAEVSSAQRQCQNDNDGGKAGDDAIQGSPSVSSPSS
jgi:hypothetical protein